jgi:hypothetical protein
MPSYFDARSSGVILRRVRRGFHDISKITQNLRDKELDAVVISPDTLNLCVRLIE